MFQRRLKQTRVQTLSIGKCYELLFQLNTISQFYLKKNTKIIFLIISFIIILHIDRDYTGCLIILWTIFMGS